MSSPFTTKLHSLHESLGCVVILNRLERKQEFPALELQLGAELYSRSFFESYSSLFFGNAFPNLSSSTLFSLFRPSIGIINHSRLGL